MTTFLRGLLYWTRRSPTGPSVRGETEAPRIRPIALALIYVSLFVPRGILCAQSQLQMQGGPGGTATGGGIAQSERRQVNPPPPPPNGG